MKYHFLQLDVFTRRPFGGNQLAVFTDAEGLSGEQMQTLAREMNFSESTFVLPPETVGCVKKVRIFTPGAEMPMAGHPTVGTAAALVARGIVDLPSENFLMLELNIGPVRVDLEPRDSGMPFVWMTHRPPEFTPGGIERSAAAQALGLEEGDIRDDLPLEIVSTGVPFLFVPIRSLEAIGRARSEAHPLRRLFGSREPANVALVTEEVTDPVARVHARMFSPHVVDIAEDPATGSMAAPLGAYLASHNLLGSGPSAGFVIEQGVEMGRPSQIQVDVEWVGQSFTRLRIGGDSVLVGEGEIFWDEGS